MDLNEVVDDQMVNGVKIEEKIVPNFDGVVDKMELQHSRIKSIEHEHRSREVEEKRLALELEIQDKVMILEVIDDNLRGYIREKLRIEKAIKGLKKKKDDLVGVKNLGEVKSEDMSRVDQMMVKKKVLGCEENVDIKEVGVWKRKCKELELRVLELEGRLRCQGKDGVSIGMKGATSKNGDDVRASRDGVKQMEGTPDQQYVLTEDTPTNKVHIRRQVAYQNEKSCDEKSAPLTPAGARPSSAAVIDDIDNRPNSQSEGISGMMSECGVLEIDGTVDGVLYEEEMSGSRENASYIMTPNTKRKRDLMVVTSDDECEDYECTPNRRALRLMENSDNDEDDVTPVRHVLNRVNSASESDDDDIPISQLKRFHAQSQHVVDLNPIRPRRRLVKYGQGEQKDSGQEVGIHPDILTTETVIDEESSENESENSVRSLSSFIVDESDDEDVEDDVSKEDAGGESDELGEASDSNLDFGEIILRLRSRRQTNSKWISEGDMLSDFGKNPELCMRAVCALYRQQTNEEKACKASIIPNGRGFSKFDATRGTLLGEFLTDGDPNSDLVKSVEELHKQHPNGLEDCRRFADHYSKQLFKIYENEEDPFFP